MSASSHANAHNICEYFHEIRGNIDDLTNEITGNCGLIRILQTCLFGPFSMSCANGSIEWIANLFSSGVPVK